MNTAANTQVWDRHRTTISGLLWATCWFAPSGVVLHFSEARRKKLQLPSRTACKLQLARPLQPTELTTSCAAEVGDCPPRAHQLCVFALECHAAISSGKAGGGVANCASGAAPPAAASTQSVCCCRVSAEVEALPSTKVHGRATATRDVVDVASEHGPQATMYSSARQFHPRYLIGLGRTDSSQPASRRYPKLRIHVAPLPHPPPTPANPSSRYLVRVMSSNLASMHTAGSITVHQPRCCDARRPAGPGSCRICTACRQQKRTRTAAANQRACN